GVVDEINPLNPSDGNLKPSEVKQASAASSPAAREWESRLAQQGPRIKTALELPTEHRDKALLKKAFEEARSFALNQTFERALRLLGAAAATANKILDDGGGPPEGGELHKTYTTHFEGARLALEQLAKVHPERAKKYEATLTNARQLGDNKKYEE